MKRKILTILAITLLVFAIVFIVLISSMKKSVSTSDDSIQLNLAARLIEMSDSIRNSDPKTALLNYNEAISLLQKLKKEKNQQHHLANSYTGIADVCLQTGEYQLAFKNDSIAKCIAVQSDDKQIITKALVLKGVIFYRLGEHDKAMDCYTKAMDLAIEIKDFKLQAKIFSNLAMIYYYKGNNQKALEGFTNALEIGKQIKNNELIAGNYMNLATVYNNLSINDSVLTYNKRALDLYKKINDKNGEVLCNRNIGNIYYDYSDFGKAIEYYQLSVKLALEMNDKVNTAKGYHNLAEVYIHLGDNATATDLLFKSIKIKEQLNDKLSLAKGYFGIGEMYFTQSDFSKAMTYFRKSLKLSQELKYSTQIGSNLNSIACIFSSESKSDSAIVYFKKAMETYRQTDYTYGISNLYINLGDEYRVKKNYLESEKLLIKALQSKIALDETEGIAIVNNHLANLFLSKSDGLNSGSAINLLIKAESFGLASYKTAKRLGTLPIMKEASKVLKKIYQQQGKYPDALNYSGIFNTLSDSILNKEKIQSLTFAEARWNIEKKQQEIKELERIQQLNQEIIQRKEAETGQQKIIIWSISTIFLLLTISVVIAALFIRKRRYAEYQRQLVAITALRMQNARNAMSPHFFFNLLASLSGLGSQPEILKEKLKNLSLLLRKVIENIDRTAIPLTEELEAVKAYISLYKENIPAPFSVEYLIEEGTMLKSLIPSMMIQIPVENAIKHGLMSIEGEKILIIRVTNDAEYQHIAINDNGIGLNASKGLSAGTGTGLKVLLQTILLLNAKNAKKIKFSVNDHPPDSSFTSGTAVKIEIPLNFNYALDKK